MSVHLNEHLHIHLHFLASSPNMLYLLLKNLTLSLGLDSDGKPESVEPQSSMSDRSTSLQGDESPQHQNGKKTRKEVEKPSDLPTAKKHKSVDSDEDDEDPSK